MVINVSLFRSQTLHTLKLLIAFIFSGKSPGWSSLCSGRRPVSDLRQLVGGGHQYGLQRSPGDGGLEEGGGLLRLHRLVLLPAAPAGRSSHLPGVRAEGETSTSAVQRHAQQQRCSVQRQLLPPDGREVRPGQVRQLQDEQGGAVRSTRLQLPEESSRCVQGLQSVSVDTTRQLQDII